MLSSDFVLALCRCRVLLSRRNIVVLWIIRKCQVFAIDRSIDSSAGWIHARTTESGRKARELQRMMKEGADAHRVRRNQRAAALIIVIGRPRSQARCNDGNRRHAGRGGEGNTLKGTLGCARCTRALGEARSNPRASDETIRDWLLTSLLGAHERATNER